MRSRVVSAPGRPRDVVTARLDRTLAGAALFRTLWRLKLIVCIVNLKITRKYAILSTCFGDALF